MILDRSRIDGKLRRYPAGSRAGSGGLGRLILGVVGVIGVLGPDDDIAEPKDP